ncbi:MAG: helix-turn-helix transcriptional regulator [Leptospirales bacterium]|nr:helix-turn-helix transcriptional regulator [Leptospirales bacterium]
MASKKRQNLRRPIMELLDLLGKRWMLRIFWELRDGQACSFRDLQQRCDDLSPSVLNVRLKELRAAGYLAVQADGYALTPTGLELLQILGALNDFAAKQTRR